MSTTCCSLTVVFAYLYIPDGTFCPVVVVGPIGSCMLTDWTDRQMDSNDFNQYFTDEQQQHILKINCTTLSRTVSGSLRGEMNCVHLISLGSAWQIQMQPETKPHHANHNRGHSKNIVYYVDTDSL